MFNSYHYSSETTFKSPDTIKEYRAPTEESVKLLREMEQEVKKTFVGRFETPKDNPIQFQTMAFLDNNNRDAHFLTRIMINDQLVTTETPFSAYGWGYNIDDVGKRIIEDISRAIVKELLMQNEDSEKALIELAKIVRCQY